MDPVYSLQSASQGSVTALGRRCTRGSSQRNQTGTLAVVYGKRSSAPAPARFLDCRMTGPRSHYAGESTPSWCRHIHRCCLGSMKLSLLGAVEPDGGARLALGAAAVHWPALARAPSHRCRPPPLAVNWLPERNTVTIKRERRLADGSQIGA